MAKALLAVDLQNDFYENGALAVADASEINTRVNEVDIVGLAFDYCVKYTARDSAENGFKTTVILEGTRA
ncbi:MAG: nicotinamidase/pyrazinamidase, partial [Halanaerobium sp.]